MYLLGLKAFYYQAPAQDHINLKCRWTPVSPQTTYHSPLVHVVLLASLPTASQGLEDWVWGGQNWHRENHNKTSFLLSCSPPKSYCPTWELGIYECSDESRGLSYYFCPAFLFSFYLMYRVTWSSHLHKELLITLTLGFQQEDWSFSLWLRENEVSWECCILIRGI